MALQSDSHHHDENYAIAFARAGLLLPAAFHRGSGEDSAVELQAGIHDTASPATAHADSSRVSCQVSCTTFAFNQPEHLADSDRCNQLLVEVCS